ncbi:MAG: archease [Chloroflexota bacterium]
MKIKAGFREIEHTADLAIEVWAPDLPSLFSQAAQAMYTVARVQLAETPRINRLINLHAQDIESMLVLFLNELIFLGECDEVGFDEMDLRLSGEDMECYLSGADIKSKGREIKAATYHGLEVRSGADGYRAKVVFDV